MGIRIYILRLKRNNTLRESFEDITMSVFRTGARLISATKTRSALIPAPSLCNAALQGQVIVKRTLLERPGVPENIKKVYFNLQGFNQYGLLHDDVLHETDIVQLAISRLPPEMQDERNFRVTRALQCSVEKTVLPKDQWSTWEEHKEKGFYLKPYLDEVVREIEEKEAWNKNWISNCRLILSCRNKIIVQT